MPVAGYLFIAGVLLLGVCGFRINVRVLIRLGARHRKRSPDDLLIGYMTAELERIRLKDAVGLEIAGLAIAVATVAVAIQFLKFA